MHALKGVDAVVPAGRLTAITGPSGSGKSSLLRILAAQDRPTAGRAEVAGHAAHRALRAQAAGAAAQAHRLRLPRPPQNLLPHLTGREHLAMAASFRGSRRTEATKQGEELLDLLGIADRAEHLPGQLSGGEQQRLAFAQAVIGRPALVVADEPTSELDSATTADLLAAVHQLTRTGTTVVMATHDPLAAGAADQVIHLRSGAVSHEEVGGRRLAVIDGDGRIQLPEEALARFAARRVLIDITPEGVILREPDMTSW